MDIQHQIDSDKTEERRWRKDGCFILGACVGVYLLAAKFDVLERIVLFAEQHEKWELDELITVSIFLMFALLLFSIRRWQDAKTSQKLLSEQNKTLESALNEIKQLKGIIPICASCKKIRNDAGFWEQVESYVSKNSSAEFSHSMCPKCLDEYYGKEEWYIEEKQKKGK